jgi:hypothetical protein
MPKANKEQRQADQITARIEQACAIPIQYGDEEGGNHPAAKQTPKRQTLPASGLGRGPDTEGRSEQGTKQQEIERGVSDQTCCENEIG